MSHSESLTRASFEHDGSRGLHESSQTTHLTYAEGVVLNLSANDTPNQLLDVRIIRLYRPFSNACVMYVEILNHDSMPSSIPERAVLKLYDRRLTTTLRNDRNVGSWNSDLEDDFVEYVNSGSADGFVRALQQSEYPRQADEDWTDVECEAYLQFWCSDMFATELKTYHHLQSLQGKGIPQIFSSVMLSAQLPPGNESPVRNKASPLLQIPGMLMEHVMGPTLAKMPDYVPSQHWQRIVNEALNIVHLYSDRQVIKEGIRVENIIANPVNDGSGDFRVVMLDFAQSDIRRADQSEADWGRWKAEEDEEGAIASLMSAILTRVGFTLQYAPSDRYREFATNE